MRDIPARLSGKAVPIPPQLRLAGGDPGLPGWVYLGDRPGLEVVFGAANVANEAATCAVRAEREVLNASDFDEARDRIVLGRRDGSNVLLPEEKRAVAVRAKSRLPRSPGPITVADHASDLRWFRLGQSSRVEDYYPARPGSHGLVVGDHDNGHALLVVEILE